jgi:hypothetical protein
MAARRHDEQRRDDAAHNGRHRRAVMIDGSRACGGPLPPRSEADVSSGEPDRRKLGRAKRHAPWSPSGNSRSLAETQLVMNLRGTIGAVTHPVDVERSGS